MTGSDAHICHYNHRLLRITKQQGFKDDARRAKRIAVWEDKVWDFLRRGRGQRYVKPPVISLFHMLWPIAGCPLQELGGGGVERSNGSID